MATVSGRFCCGKLRRPANEGGQRWYHLYAGEDVRAGDPLHWTGRQSNANFMCIDCHTTGYQKQYDATTRRYGSTWRSAGVSCKACHGPGSLHVAWANTPWPLRFNSGNGVRLALSGRDAHAWRIAANTGNAAAPGPSDRQRKETELCAHCHADKPAPWAACWASQWYPRLHERPAPLAGALAASERGDADALLLLLSLLGDPQQPSIARATALARLPVASDPKLIEHACAQTRDSDALLRKTAADALADAPPAERARWRYPHGGPGSVTKHSKPSTKLSGLNPRVPFLRRLGMQCRHARSDGIRPTQLAYALLP